MWAISSEIVNLLKVKLSLQNDQRRLLLLSWFSNFFGGGPPPPPFQIRKYVMYFSIQHFSASTQTLVKSEAFS